MNEGVKKMSVRFQGVEELSTLSMIGILIGIILLISAFFIKRKKGVSLVKNASLLLEEQTDDHKISNIILKYVPMIIIILLFALMINRIR